MRSTFNPAQVTYHAVTRYVQRVMGISVECEGEGRESAEAHAAAAGLNVDEVKARILTPAVAAAIEIGALRATVGASTFLIRDGAVVTVTERKLPVPPPSRRLRVLSAKEERNAFQRYNRRQRQRDRATEQGE